MATVGYSHCNTLRRACVHSWHRYFSVAPTSRIFPSYPKEPCAKQPGANHSSSHPTKDDIDSYFHPLFLKSLARDILSEVSRFPLIHFVRARARFLFFFWRALLCLEASHGRYGQRIVALLVTTIESSQARYLSCAGARLNDIAHVRLLFLSPNRFHTLFPPPSPSHLSPGGGFRSLAII